MARYTPRRQAKKFLDGDCPKEVLAIFDNGGKTFDRYTVIYTHVEFNHRGEPWLGYRGMSEHPFDPQGFGIYSEFGGTWPRIDAPPTVSLLSGQPCPMT
jgi:hypothetical protein